MNKLTARIILGLIIALPIVGLAVMDYEQAAFVLGFPIAIVLFTLILAYLLYEAIG